MGLIGDIKSEAADVETDISVDISKIRGDIDHFESMLRNCASHAERAILHMRLHNSLTNAANQTAMVGQHYMSEAAKKFDPLIKTVKKDASIVDPDGNAVG